MATHNRPISPHLQVYKPQLTSVLSITHRASGVFLALGTLLLVYWIVAIASGPDAYSGVRQFFGSVIGRLLLLAWSYALFFHLCNGIRHLFWDVGLGFDMKSVYASGWAVVMVSVMLTLLTWLTAFTLVGRTS